jgi:hypothetical protein
LEYNQGFNHFVSRGATNHVMMTTTKAVKSMVRGTKCQSVKIGATVKNKVNTVGKIPNHVTTATFQRGGGCKLGPLGSANQSAKPLS